MFAVALSLALSAAPVRAAPAIDILGRIAAETALEQAERIDPGWHPDQRDCAGLIRFSYRAAYAKLDPARLERGLFRDEAGAESAFADAETLLDQSFVLLGRGDDARRALKNGDVAAFRQLGTHDGEPVHHLMFIARAPGAKGGALVVYHPGERGASVRAGALGDLIDQAPIEWRPVAENKAFLGFFRFREWMR